MGKVMLHKHGVVAMQGSPVTLYGARAGLDKNLSVFDLGEGWSQLDTSFSWDIKDWTSAPFPYVDIRPLVAGTQYRVSGTVAVLEGSAPAMRIRLGNIAADDDIILDAVGPFNEIRTAGSDNNEFKLFCSNETNSTRLVLAKLSVQLV